MTENLGTGEIFSDVIYFVYIFFGEKFSTPKKFPEHLFSAKKQLMVKIAIMEYRIDLKASEAVQAYTLQKANAAKTKHYSRRRTHHKIQK